MPDHAERALDELQQIDTDGIEVEHERAVSAVCDLAGALGERRPKSLTETWERRSATP